MITVPTFQAYALSRPSGWPAGVYDGTFGEDGLRLIREGNEVLHLPVGSQVRVNGAGLILPVAGGELEVELRPPAPADPTATALAFALCLAGSREAELDVLDRSYGVPGWVILVALLPLAASIVGAFLGGWWVTGLGVLMLLMKLVLFNSRWDVEKRTQTVVALSAVGTTLVVMATVVGMMFRAATTAAPVPAPMRRY